jgi:hypothetical protein
MRFLETYSAKAFYLALFIAVIQVALQFAVPAMRYNDRPPFVVWDTKVLTPVLAANQMNEFRFSYHYNTRPECHPPLGTGEKQFRIWINTGSGFDQYYDLPMHRASAAVPEQHFRISDVNIPPMQPGFYMLQYRAIHICKWASQSPIFSDGPLMPFEVK